MKFISLQHISIEDPGTFKDFLIEDGHSITTIQLDEGDSIPNNLDEFDAMLCMGGPMDTFMEDQYPWLVAEKKAIGEYVLNLKKPFLGFCLGCQLLGEVLGGKVVESTPPEIGVLDINIEEGAKEDHIFDFLPNKITSEFFFNSLRYLSEYFKILLLKPPHKPLSLDIIKTNCLSASTGLYSARSGCPFSSDIT